MKTHHPVFQEFLADTVSDGCFQVDLLGIRTRREFLSGAAAEYMQPCECYPPPIDEEYFEWIDLLESLRSARETYTLMELGAGFGRWSVRAAALISRFRALQAHFIAVEPEPRHFRWLEQHLRDNGVDPAHHTLIRAAVGTESGSALFYIGAPQMDDDQASQWYGQAIVKSYEVPNPESHGRYEGCEVVHLRSGWKCIRTSSVTLRDILPPSDRRIDLIDMDLQGQELNVIASAIDELDARAARLHIATHDHSIEDDLRKVLGGHGWVCTADYPCQSESDTPWGVIRFLDGVQSWFNPRVNVLNPDARLDDLNIGSG